MVGKITYWSKATKVMRDDKKKDCIHRFAVLLGLVSPGWIAGGAIRDHFSGQSIECPACRFHVSREEIEAIEAIEKMFAPAMDAATAIFEEWRKERGSVDA